MAKNALVTKDYGNSGAVSRFTNTERWFVGPELIRAVSVTGTWALELGSNIVSLATDDVGGAGEVLAIPFPGRFSDAEVQSGDGVTDRGVKVVGVELLYTVAASALAAFDLDIYKLTFDADGDPTATEVTTTLSLDGASDDGTEIDDHRAEALIAEVDRFFVDSGNVVYAQIVLSDGTASDVNIYGAIWHVERYQE